MTEQLSVGGLTRRIIPCLDVTAGRVVKGVNFVDLRDAGDPVELAAFYDRAGADELVFLDITASSDSRRTVIDLVERTAEQVFIPLTVGGGVRAVDDIRTLLGAGADKVSLNTAAVRDPALISRGAEAFGSQCIVVAIDARRDPAAPSGWGVYTHGGRTPDRPGCRGLGARGGGARGRRDPADQHGPRRHQGRLRPAADAGDRRGRARAGDRLGWRGHPRPLRRGAGPRRRRRGAGRVDLPLRRVHGAPT